jgi:acetolactate synthase-1/3 small subunit
MSRHTLVATVEEGSATLNRVLSLIRQRSFAIESLSIGKTNEPGIMRLTIVVDGARSAVDQVTKQLYKVVEVRKVSDLSEDPRVERELALVKVSCKTAPHRAEVLQIADIYRARIVDVGNGSLMIEVTGPSAKVDAMLELLRVYGVRELVRTGVVAMARGHGASSGAQSRPDLRLVG